MRLRLTVQRNNLPATNILWSVPDSNSTQAYTITRLLEDVNHIVPLEAEHWGLEHYVVEVGGFECLHFMPVAHALKEDDHVCIRPLMTAEVRARTLAGRDQISDAGQHLVDGIPFGRPYLRHPNRPAVRIPPRKRQRLDNADIGAEVDAIPVSHIEHGRPSQLLLENRPGKLGLASSRPASKAVQFKEPTEEQNEESDEDDEVYVPDSSDRESDEHSDDSSDDDSSDDDSDDDSDDGNGGPVAESDSSSASDSSDTDSDSVSDSSSSSDSESDSDIESDASAPPDILSSKTGKKNDTTESSESPPHVPPGQGTKNTKIRNDRRKRSGRLRKLKELGVLHEDADWKDLFEFEGKKRNVEQVPSQKSEITTLTLPFSQSTGKRKRAADEPEATNAVADSAVTLEQRRQELISKYEKYDESSEGTVLNTEREIEKNAAQDAVESQPVAATRRLRPDVKAISRIIVRQATQPANKKSRSEAVVEKPTEPEGASDPGFWKTRINLSAFECWDENFELATPPFPFEQHWDPASTAMKGKHQKKHKKQKQAGAPHEMPPAEEDEEEILLDYDGTADVEMDDNINAAVEDQLLQDVVTAAQSHLPDLPEDINTLPDLTSADIREGAIITCKFFAVDPVTITPEISGYKTAVVEKEGDSGNGAGTIQLRIAERDLPKRQKRFDSKGERIYDVVDGFILRDDDADEALWEGQFSELIEAKLLQAA